MAEGFVMGDAFVQIRLVDPSPANEEQVRKRTETGLGKNPPKVPVKLRDPVDAAFRARLNRELQDAAKGLAELPITADTERFRRDTGAKIKAISKTLQADVPLEVADAAKWRAEVTAQAEQVSRSVSARIPVEVTADRKSQRITRRTLIRWAAEVGAVVGPAGIIGGAIVGTAGLFAGVGIAAEKSNQDVTRAYTSLRDTVVGDTQKLAAPIVPALVDVADKTGATFHDMEDQIGSAFSVVGPQIDDLAGGILGLAREALPGLTGVLRASGPVVRVISDDLTGLGKATAGFLDGLSKGAPGAAEGIDAILGDVEDILPPLGRFIGQAANLTGVILHDLSPAVHAAGNILDGVSVIVDHTSSVLGPLAASALGVYGAFRLWRGITGIVGGIGGSLGSLTSRFGGAEDGASRLSRATRGAATGLGILGVATAGVTTAFASYKQDVADQVDEIKRWVDATHSQGQAGAALRQELSALADRYDQDGGVAKVFADRIRSGIKASDDARAALGPLGRDADDVAAAQDRVADAFDRYGDSSPQYKQATDDLSTALERQRDDQKAVDRATRDATLSLKDQLLTIQGAVDKQLGYEQSVTGVADAQSGLRQAQQDLNDAISKYPPKSDEARQAQLRLREAQDRVKQSYYDQADAAAALAVQQGATDGGAKAYRDTLATLAAKLGPKDPLRQNLEDTIAELDAAGKQRETKMKADITDLQRKADIAKKIVSSLPGSHTSTFHGNVTDVLGKVAEVQRRINILHGTTIAVGFNVAGAASITPHATGGIDLPRPGGRVIRVAEAGSAEATIPLNAQGARFLRQSIGPLFAGSPAPTTATAAPPTVNNTFNVALTIQADSLRKAADVLDLFDNIQQTARSGGRL